MNPLIPGQKHVYLLSNAHGTKADAVFNAVVSKLQGSGVVADWGPYLPNSIESYHLIILNHANGKSVRDTPTARILGASTLSRAERLELAQSLGVQVAPWATPPTIVEVRKLFEAWDVEYLIVKRDGTFQREGVYMIARDSPLLDQECLWHFVSSRDVVMKPLTGDPTTFKVDAFLDYPLFGYRYNTPSIENPLFYSCDISFNSFEIPEELKRAIGRIGQTLALFGVGYYSADFMFDNGWYLIELNTSAIATSGPWLRWNSTYSETYSEALLQCLALKSTWHTRAEIDFHTTLWRNQRSQ